MGKWSSVVSVGDVDRGVGVELCRVGWRVLASQHRLVQLAAQFAAGDVWIVDGAASAAHWIAEALDVEVCTAREWIRVGRALGELPGVDAAFACRELSYAKVRQLTRVASPEHEGELVDLARRTPAGGLGAELAAWRAGRESDDDIERRHRRDRGLRWRTDVDGMVVGSFRLPPLAAAQLTAAVDAVVMRTTPAATVGGGDASVGASGSPWVAGSGLSRWPSLAQQRADALVAAVTGGGATVATEVVLHVRGDGCSLDDGTPVAATVVERIASGGFLRALIHDADGRPINASGRQRHPTVRQRRVVRERDRVCVDCGSGELLEFDHVPDFRASRRTLVDELRLRCGPCHRRRHQPAAIDDP